MLKNTIGTASGKEYFNLYLYADSVLKQTHYHLQTDTVIIISGKRGFSYQVLIKKNGFSDVAYNWKFDTIRVNYVKNLFLEESSIQLKNITITSQREIYKRGDTLVLPVDNLKTMPHASASELLDKIPGFTVNSNGTVSMLGKKVGRIKVDGVEVFDGNPKATLENLRSDMLKDVEVINLSGEAGGGVELNLRLKSDKKTGTYGELYGQQGTAGRSNFGIKLNDMKPGSFLSSFINYNNQNQQVLSPNDYFKLVGFNNEISNTLATQKLYYDNKLEDSFNGLNKIGELFPFLQKGVRQTLSSGVNLSKTFKKISWNSYFLGSFSNYDMNDLSNTIRSLGKFKAKEFENSFSSTRNHDITFQSSLNWLPDENNIINAKLVLARKSVHDDLSHQLESYLYTSSDTLLNDALIDTKQQIVNKNNLIFISGNWEHRYKNPATKTVLSGGLLINDIGYDNEYFNQVHNANLSFNNNNVVGQTNRNYNYYATVQHSMPLNRKFLIDFRLNSMISNNKINRMGDNVMPDGSLRESDQLSAKNFHFHNNHTSAQTFLFYKTGKLSVIAGVGALNTDWEVSGRDTSYNKINKVYILPGFYLNYRFGKSKIAVRYVRGQISPAAFNLVPATDSSRFQQTVRGNPILQPYMADKYEVNSNIFIGGFGDINFSLGYTSKNSSITDDYSITGGLYPLQSYLQYRKIDEITGVVSYFRFNPGSLLNPYFFLFYLRSNQYQLTGDVATKIEFSAISPEAGLKLNIEKEHTINFSVQAVINKTYSSNPLNQVTSRFNIAVKDDNKILDRLYYKFSAKWTFIYANARYSYNKPIISFSLYKYIGRLQNWQINAGINNLLNVDQVKLINAGVSQTTTSSYNYLSRYINLGITFYPEKWKK